MRVLTSSGTPELAHGTPRSASNTGTTELVPLPPEIIRYSNIENNLLLIYEEQGKWRNYCGNRILNRNFPYSEV